MYSGPLMCLEDYFESVAIIISSSISCPIDDLSFLCKSEGEAKPGPHFHMALPLTSASSPQASLFSVIGCP